MNNITTLVNASNQNAASTASTSANAEINALFAQGAREALKGFIAPVELAVIDWKPTFKGMADSLMSVDEVASPLFSEMLHQTVIMLASNGASFNEMITELRHLQGFWMKGSKYLPKDICIALSNGFKALTVKASLSRRVWKAIVETSKQLG